MEKGLHDLFGAIQLTLTDDWQTYATISAALVLLSASLVVACSFSIAVVEHLRNRWQLLIPAVRAAFSKLREKRMNVRKRTEEVKILASDAITEALDILLLAGKISKKERTALWDKLGKSMELPDLLRPRKKHPEAVKAAIQHRRDTTDKTPIPFPDQKFSASERWKAMLAARKTA